jgi:hypothetical protein
MQMATTAPQSSRCLFAVGPDMAKILAEIALRKAFLSSAQLYLDNNMVNAVRLEYLLRFYVSC